MNNKLFIDTNVYLDLLLQRGEMWKEIEVIFKLTEENEITIYSSASNLLNIIYIMQTHKLQRKEIVSHANLILSFTKIINPDNKIFEQALSSDFSDIEDAVQYFTALNMADIDYFITSNVKDYKKAIQQLPVITPKQYLNLYQK